jgi:hypothetical protein
MSRDSLLMTHDIRLGHATLTPRFETGVPSCEVQKARFDSPVPRRCDGIPWRSPVEFRQWPDYSRRPVSAVPFRVMAGRGVAPRKQGGESGAVQEWRFDTPYARQPGDLPEVRAIQVVTGTLLMSLGALHTSRVRPAGESWGMIGGGKIRPMFRFLGFQTAFGANQKESPSVAGKHSRRIENVFLSIPIRKSPGEM